MGPIRHRVGRGGGSINRQLRILGTGIKDEDEERIQGDIIAGKGKACQEQGCTAIIYIGRSTEPRGKRKERRKAASNAATARKVKTEKKTDRQQAGGMAAVVDSGGDNIMA